jgi:outer membrane protein OmpA-like peptidoglycan-associated protein
MINKTILTVTLTAFLAAGCTTTDPQTGETRRNNMATGAIIGAIGGAAVGAATNDKDDQRRKNAIIGAGIGAITGAAVGGYMDEQQRKLAEQMRQANNGVTVTRTAEDEITLNMPSDVTFDVDRADVKPQFRATLADVANTLRQYESTTIDVIGHADASGADAYNQALSERRSDAVAAFLQQNGVQSARIVSVGMGETRPITTNDTVEGRAKNRRVEIKLRPVTQG